jgi:TRAP-type C4-dicarboxylate transport system substrate-binding protein
MAANFPDSPSVNDTFSIGTRNYYYDGAQWLLANTSVAASSAFNKANLANQLANGAFLQANVANTLSVGNTMSNGYFTVRTSQRTKLNFIPASANVRVNVDDDSAGDRINVTIEAISGGGGGASGMNVTLGNTLANTYYLNRVGPYANINLIDDALLKWNINDDSTNFRANVYAIVDRAPFNVANNANLYANLAFMAANAAFAVANLALPLTGGTMSGNINFNATRGLTWSGFGFAMIAETGNLRVSGANLVQDSAGSTRLSPRILGTSPQFASGEAARWQFGDAFNAIQNGYGSKMDIYAYHGIRISGGRADLANLAFADGTGGTDYSLEVLANTTSPGALMMRGNLHFTDASYDIGKSDLTVRPRSIYLSENLVSGHVITGRAIVSGLNVQPAIVAAFLQANNSNLVTTGNTMANGYYATRSTRRMLNFIPGTNMTINVDDDAGGDHVNISLSAAVAGATDLNVTFGNTLANGFYFTRSPAYANVNLIDDTLMNWNISSDATNFRINVYPILSRAPFDTANTANLYANLAFRAANAVYDFANTININVAATMLVANNANVYANLAFRAANAAYDFANAINIKVDTTGNALSNVANTYSNGYVVLQSSRGTLNFMADTVDIKIRVQDNSTHGLTNVRFDAPGIGLAYTAANAAFDVANSHNGAMAQMNSAIFGVANNANLYANLAFRAANAAFDFANIIYTNVAATMLVANTANVYANLAFRAANAAYDFANAINIKVDTTGNALSNVANTYSNGYVVLQSSRGTLNFMADTTDIKIRIQDNATHGLTNVRFDAPGIGAAYTLANSANILANQLSAVAQTYSNGYVIQMSTRGTLNFMADTTDIKIAVQDNATHGLVNVRFDAPGIGAAYTQANAAKTEADAVFGVANVHNGAMSQMNTAIFGVANNANLYANLAFRAANAVYDFANVININVAATMLMANFANLLANSLSNVAQTYSNGYVVLQSSRGTLNFMADTTDIKIRVQDNATHGLTNVRFDLPGLGLAYAQSNIAMLTASTAYDKANLANQLANGAFLQANAANLLAVGNTLGNGYFLQRASRSKLNFIDSTSVTWNIADDSVGDRINVTIALSQPAGSDKNTMIGNTTAAGTYTNRAGPYANINFLDDALLTWNINDDATAFRANVYAIVDRAPFNTANTANLYANLAFRAANAAYDFANAINIKVDTTGNALSNVANTYSNGYVVAQSSRGTLNFMADTTDIKIRIQDNATHGLTNVRFDAPGIGLAYAQSNIAMLTVSSAYDRVNVVSGVANTANDRANLAQMASNAAFAVANLALPAAGGTITGDLRVNGLIQGNVVANVINILSQGVGSNTGYLRVNTGNVHFYSTPSIETWTLWANSALPSPNAVIINVKASSFATEGHFFSILDDGSRIFRVSKGTGGDTIAAVLGPQSGSGPRFQIAIPGESFGRINFGINGTDGIPGLGFGDGTNARDIGLERLSTGNIRVTDYTNNHNYANLIASNITALNTVSAIDGRFSNTAYAGSVRVTNNVFTKDVSLTGNVYAALNGGATAGRLNIVGSVNNMGIGIYDPDLRWTIASYAGAGLSARDFTFYNEQTASDAMIIDGNTNNATFGGDLTTAANVYTRDLITSRSAIVSGLNVQPAIVAAFLQANNSNLVITGNTMANTYYATRSTRRMLNFVPGTGISINVDDDSAGDHVNISIASSVTGQDKNVTFGNVLANGYYLTRSSAFSNVALLDDDLMIVWNVDDDTAQFRVNAKGTLSRAPFAVANNANLYANLAFRAANAVYDFANVININVAATMLMANFANILANSLSNVAQTYSNGYVVLQSSRGTLNFMADTTDIKIRIQDNATHGLTNVRFDAPGIGAAYAQSNIAMLTVSSAYDRDNVVSGVANNANVYANLAFRAANAVYDFANVININVAATMLMANFANILANQVSNVAQTFSNGYVVQISSRGILNFMADTTDLKIRVHDNATHGLVNVRFDAPGIGAAYAQSNIAMLTSSTAYDKANAANSIAQAGLIQANTSNNMAVGNTIASNGYFTVRGNRTRLNFLPGANVTVNVTEDVAGDRINVSIESYYVSGPGGPGGSDMNVTIGNTQGGVYTTRSGAYANINFINSDNDTLKFNVDSDLTSFRINVKTILAPVFVSDSPPASPIANTLWFESNTGSLFLYYADSNSSQFIELGGFGPGLEREEVLTFAITDEFSQILTGANRFTYHFPKNFTVLEVIGSLSQNSSSGNTFVDVNKNGTSIFTQNVNLYLANSHTINFGAPTLSATTITFSKGDKLNVNVGAAGTSAAGLKLHFRGYWVA